MYVYICINIHVTSTIYIQHLEAYIFFLRPSYYDCFFCNLSKIGQPGLGLSYLVKVVF